MHRRKETSYGYFSTIYQFSFSMGCLLFSGTDEQQQEWKAPFCVGNGLYRGRKKFCIEYVRNANYNIQGVHSEGWIEQTGTLPGMNGQLAVE